MLQWHQDYQDLCYFPANGGKVNPHIKHFEQLLQLLNKEPSLATYLMEKVKTNNTAFCLDNSLQNHYSLYNIKLNVITLNNNSDFYEQFIFLVHELRHLDQVTRGFCTSLPYDIKEIAHLTLATEADAQAVTTLFAWRLKENGFLEVWEYLLEIESYQDIAFSFEQAYLKSKDELLAINAAFDAWYASDWRPGSYYFGACMSYFSDLEKGRRLPSDALLPEHFFDTLCLLPEDQNYACHLPKQLE